jgi:hypothetical protein
MEAIVASVRKTIGLKPSVAVATVLVDLLKLTDVDKAKQWVAEDLSIWKELGGKLKLLLASGAFLLEGLDWLSPSWLIKAIRKGHPKLAEYFDGDAQAYDWLTKQIESIKYEVNKYPVPWRYGQMIKGLRQKWLRRGGGDGTISWR